MTELTVRLNEFDAALLEDLVKNTGESKQHWLLMDYVLYIVQ